MVVSMDGLLEADAELESYHACRTGAYDYHMLSRIFCGTVLGHFCCGHYDTWYVNEMLAFVCGHGRR